MQVYRTYALLLLSTPYHHDHQTELQPPLSFILLFYIVLFNNNIFKSDWMELEFGFHYQSPIKGMNTTITKRNSKKKKEISI